MSIFKPAKCPNCGGELQLPEDKDIVTCMYCDTKIIVKEAIDKEEKAKKENFLELADRAKDVGNYQEAINYYNKYLEIDINSTKVWLGKAETTALMTTKENFRIDESIKYYKKIIELAKPDEKEKIEREIYNKIRDLLNIFYPRFLIYDNKQLFKPPYLQKEKKYFQEISIKFIFAYKEIEIYFDEDVKFIKEILELLKTIHKTNYKFPKNIVIHSPFLNNKIKKNFSKYISHQKSHYSKKITYLNKLSQWRNAGEKGPKPKMPKITSSNLALIIVIISILGFIGFCTITSMISNSCENRSKRAEELRQTEIQDSIRQEKVEDSLEQIRIHEAFIDSLKIHDPDSFTALLKIESLRIESLEQIRIEDSLEQIRIQDSIAEVVRQDSIAEERRFRTLKNKMRINYEEALNINWVKHGNSPRYVNSRRHMCYPYFGLKSALDKWLILTIGYNLTDWLFINKITVKVDDTEHELTFNRSDVSQDVTGYGVSEWIDLSGKESLIRNIANASEVWVIYWGSDGRDSYQLSSSEIQVFKEIIELFDICKKTRFASKLK